MLTISHDADETPARKAWDGHYYTEQQSRDHYKEHYIIPWTQAQVSRNVSQSAWHIAAPLGPSLAPPSSSQQSAPPPLLILNVWEPTPLVRGVAKPAAAPPPTAATDNRIRLVNTFVDKFTSVSGVPGIHATILSCVHWRHGNHVHHFLHRDAARLRQCSKSIWTISWYDTMWLSQLRCGCCCGRCECDWLDNGWICRPLWAVA